MRRMKEKRKRVFDETFEKLRREDIDNPVIREYDETPEEKTNIEHIKELQEILVQTVIDYIGKNDLTDIDAVDFHVDGLKGSVPHKEWCPCTDSAITVKGEKHKCIERKDGKVIKLPYYYDIGSYM